MRRVPVSYCVPPMNTGRTSSSSAARFRTGGRAGPLSASIALDELLADLGALGSWPHPQGVEWEPELRTLVAGVVQDANTVKERLDKSQGPTETAPGDVRGLLGETWRGELSEFQLRDIAKLLSLQHGANFSVPGAGKTRVALAVYAAQKAQGRVHAAVGRLPQVGLRVMALRDRRMFPVCLADTCPRRLDGPVDGSPDRQL